MAEIVLLACELLLYALGMLAAFRARRRLGLGVFLTAIGSLHFLETYLAANLYVQVAPGLSLSPGSVVLFSGKFLFILLLYIREDATIARQPIYGLLYGNLLAVLLGLLLARHVVLPGTSGASNDLNLLDPMGVLMVWGSVLLFVDCLLVILLYERLSRRSRLPVEVRIWCAAVVVLVFDQIGFFSVLHLSYDVPLAAGIGGLVGKVVAATLYAVLIGQYLRHFERAGPVPADVPADGAGPTLFGTLTYRQRYEALREQARHDAVTHLLNRGEFERQVGLHLARALRERRALHLVLIDIDHFKSVNDLYGHQTGDLVLREVAEVVGAGADNGASAFRFGGDEFAMLVTGIDHDAALALAERLRAAIAQRRIGEGETTVTVSIGVSTLPAGSNDGNVAELVRIADAMLYQAKADGRDRVAGTHVGAR
ncbi:MAG: GGDEF domain-containing protein [Xanthomonadales bacterium]|nr:GGDEF domain-containing protein [Xanthomonadales bacterium]